MFNQNLDTNGDKDQAAEQFRLEAAGDLLAETECEGKAQQTPQEGNRTDRSQRPGQGSEGVIPRTGKCNADSQGVDTGRHGKYRLRLQAPGIESFLLFLLEGIQDHLPAEEEQDTEGDPMIVRLDVRAEPARQDPAEERHQRLKKPEKNGRRQHWPRLPLPQQQTADDGYRKAVHRQRHRYEKNFQHSTNLRLRRKKNKKYISQNAKSFKPGPDGEKP